MNKNLQIIIGLVLLVVIIGFAIWFPKQPLNDGTPETITQSDSIGSLLSHTWVWEQTIMSDDTIITPEKTESFSLTFGSDGRVTGTTDCNNFFGSYSLDESQITFGPLANTLMYCEGSQESVFTRQLENVQMVFFDENDNLVLLLRYDSGGIMFSKKTLPVNNPIVSDPDTAVSSDAMY
jgi:heat shock protein HslJ